MGLYIAFISLIMGMGCCKSEESQNLCQDETLAVLIAFFFSDEKLAGCAYYRQDIHVYKSRLEFFPIIADVLIYIQLF